MQGPTASSVADYVLGLLLGIGKVVVLQPVPMSHARYKCTFLIPFEHVYTCSGARSLKPGPQYDAGASVISAASRWPTLE